jgi:nitrate reductase NapAB chaperone NapD
MAIAGLLVHTLKENLEEVEAQIHSMPEMTTYGIHQDQYIVVVAEVPSDQMEKKVDRIKDIEGVLTIYTTYVTIEDELENNES